MGRLGSNKSFFKLNCFSLNHFHFLIIVLHTCKFAKTFYGTFIANLAKEVGNDYININWFFWVNIYKVMYLTALWRFQIGARNFKTLELLQFCSSVRSRNHVLMSMEPGMISQFTHFCALQNGKRMMQEEALTALASVADSVQVFLLTSLFKWFLLWQHQNLRGNMSNHETTDNSHYSVALSKAQ